MQQCSQQAILIILQTLSIVFSQGQIPARRATSEDTAQFVKCRVNKASKTLSQMHIFQ